MYIFLKTINTRLCPQTFVHNPNWYGYINYRYQSLYTLNLYNNNRHHFKLIKQTGPDSNFVEYKHVCSQTIQTQSIRSKSYWNYRKDEGKSNVRMISLYLITASTIFYGLWRFFVSKEKYWVDAAVADNLELQPFHKIERTDLPTYKMADVAKHDSLENGVWVTYGIGVYDITKFIPEHPGGDKVLMAAGSAIDPFWHIYQQHNTVQVLTMLEAYRIGNLFPDDDMGTRDLADPWSNEPKRHPILKPASQRPFNAEPPPDLLSDSFITPTELFYVRNHLPVPDIDIKTYELEIEIDGTRDHRTLTMVDLEKYPPVTITAAIMCGGNRRSEMNKVKVVKGLSWGPAAVGNANWTGVRLCDVLKEMGVESNEHSHVHFEGIDTDPTATPYAASIPLSKAMDPRGDVILAYEMNGEPLPRDHGYPLRVIVPGVVGARNVKWLGRILVTATESDSHWQQNDYKGFGPSTDWDTVDFSKSPAIQNMPVTSAICTPLPDQTVTVTDGMITVKGYAWSGGGNGIIRVDVTWDGGRTWHVADLEKQTNGSMGRQWAWTLWSIKIPVTDKVRYMEIWSKAVDSNYNVQPEKFENTWNLRGVLSHAYSRVKVKIS